jgi:hypothetical protein
MFCLMLGQSEQTAQTKETKSFALSQPKLYSGAQAKLRQKEKERNLGSPLDTLLRFVAVQA